MREIGCDIRHVACCGAMIQQRRSRGIGRSSVGAVALLSSVLASCQGADRPTGPMGNSCLETAVPAVLSLEVGASRRFDADSAECFILRRDGAGYILTAVNLGVPVSSDAPVADRLAFIRLEDPGNAASAMPANAPFVARPAKASLIGAVERERRPADIMDRPGAYASASGAHSTAAVSREEIQNRLSSAHVDDAVWIPDRWNDPSACNASSTSIPVFAVVIVAIDGNSVIAVDVRVPNLAEVLAPDARAKLERVAATLDAVYLPTMSVVISRTFQPAGGAGGRIVTLLTGITSNIGTTILYPEALPRSWCSGSIEVSIAVLPANVGEATEAQIAGTAIHEHAHGADFWVGPEISARALGTTGWATEALATTAQEQAARILAGARAAFSQGADEAERLQTLWPATRWPGTPRPEFQPLWGVHAAPPAAYGTDGLFLLSVREQLHQTWPGEGNGSRLYERLAPTGDWSLEAIADLTQTAPADLYDRFVLAVAMDDRLASDVIPPTPLPQFATWDNSWRRGDLPDEVWLPYESILAVIPFDFPLDVGAGAYGVWRINASPDEAGTGDLRLRVTPVPDHPPSILRITRYR